MKKVFLIFQLLLGSNAGSGAMMNPVKFASSLKTDGSAVAESCLAEKSNRDGTSTLPVWEATDLFQLRST